MSIGRQASALRGGAEVVVATPGRLKDLIERGDCKLDRVTVTVLDEADQMADMGFMPQVTELLDQVNPDGQRMLFSATLDRNVDLLVRTYLKDPVVIVDPAAGVVTTMEHHVLYVQGTDKYATTTEIAARDGRVIMFLHIHAWTSSPTTCCRFPSSSSRSCSGSWSGPMCSAGPITTRSSTPCPTSGSRC
ncbi:ATP-dependent RNA helicase DbpA [Streptomyces badius]